MTEYTIDYEAVKRERAAMIDDVVECLRILGLGDHARPIAPHNIMQSEIIPAITELVKRKTATCLPGGPDSDVNMLRHGKLGR